MEHMSGEALFKTVQALATDIGPRPAGHIEEQQARDYLRGQLDAAGIEDIETFQFSTIDTWGYSTIAPVVLTLAGNALARRGNAGRFVGGLGGLVGAYNLWQAMTARAQYQALYKLYPQHPYGGSLLARIKPTGEIKQKVMLIGHTDTNKHRLTFSAQLKHSMQSSSSSLLAATTLNALAMLFGWKAIRTLTELYLGVGTATLIADEIGDFVDGANDNASAVACTLGIGQQAAASPLEHTELWLAFTGSEEVGHMGLNAILDKYGEELRDAWFIDFELVGYGDIAYVTRHGGLTYFAPYRPDAQSVMVAKRVEEQHPELGVSGREIVILEEVMTLRRRGFRGICLVGLDETGWLTNWHRYSDNAANIQPKSLEQAAHFAWAMIQDIDSRTTEAGLP